MKSVSLLSERAAAIVYRKAGRFGKHYTKRENGNDSTGIKIHGRKYQTNVRKIIDIDFHLW